jgi:hypothetical protein
MKRLIVALAILAVLACGRRQVVSTDTAQSSTGVPNAATSDTSSTITPGTSSVTPTATETVAPSPPTNVSTAPGTPSATKTKH